MIALVEAARQMNIESVPVIRLNHLNKEQVRILRIFYDRIAEEAEWDKEALAAEFAELQIILPDLTITGFELEEINLMLDLNDSVNPDDDDIPPPVTQTDDCWIMGDHKLLCGDTPSLAHGGAEGHIFSGSGETVTEWQYLQSIANSSLKLA